MSQLFHVGRASNRCNLTNGELLETRSLQVDPFVAPLILFDHRRISRGIHNYILVTNIAELIPAKQ
jgi:hypothetical protein